MIGLHFAIAELHNALTVDVIHDNPRLVMLAIGGLEAKANELVEAMKRSIEQFQEKGQ
jgi:sirohydrochlorin ferrochelatase